MKRYIHYLLLIVLRCCCGTAYAQDMRIDVRAKYGITYADGDRTVAQKWAAGQDTVVLKYAWGKWRREGMPYATFRSRYVGTAVAKDCAWYNEQESFLSNNFQNTFTFAAWPVGRFKMNAKSQVPRAGMEGASSFVYAGNGSDQGQAATEFVFDDASWWPATDTERRMFEGPNASRDDDYSYNEAFTIQQLRLTGPRIKDGKTRIGLFIKRAGECSYIHQVRADGWTWGIVPNGGVPLTMGTISTFLNDIGVACMGCALSTLNIETLSGDGNGELIGLHAGYGSAAGGRVRIGMLKYEDGTTPGMPLGNGTAGSFEGQYAVSVGVVNFSNERGAVPKAMFVLNPTLGGGANQSSVLTVDAAIGYGYTKLVENVVTGTSWSSPGNYAGAQFTHYAKGDKMVTGCPDVVASTGPVTPPPVDPPPAPVGKYLDRTGWTATAFGNAPADNFGTHTAAMAVDAKASTFYHSGASQTATGNQWLAVDMKSTRSLSGVEFATNGNYPNDWPGIVIVQTSTNGTSWTERARTGGGPTTIVTFPAVPCRYFRVTPAQAKGPWWSVQEIYGLTP